MNAKKFDFEWLRERIPASTHLYSFLSWGGTDLDSDRALTESQQEPTHTDLDPGGALTWEPTEANGGQRIPIWILGVHSLGSQLELCVVVGVLLCEVW